MPVTLKFVNGLPSLDEHNRIARKVDNARGVSSRGDSMAVNAPGKNLGRLPRNPPSPVSLLQIQASATGKGIYTAKLWKVPASFDVTSDLTSATLGTAGDDCYYTNLTEVGKSTHDLMDAANTATKLFVGFKWIAASDGKFVYLGSGFYFQDCSE